MKAKSPNAHRVTLAANQGDAGMKLFMFSPEPHVVITEKKISNVNRACAKLFGLAYSKDLIGRDVLDFVPKDTRSDIKKRLASVFKEGRDSNCELKILRADGRILTAAFRGALVDYNSSPAILGIISDITDRRRDERLLRANDWLFKLHNKNLSLENYIHSIAEQLKVWSGCEIAGLKLFDRRGDKECNAGFTAKQWQHLFHEAPPLSEFGSQASIPIKFNNRIFGVIHVADKAKNIINEERIRFLEQISETIGASIKEISVETELVKNNELLEKFFGTMNILLAYLDKDLNFIRVNRAYAEKDKREPDFYVGKKHSDLFPDRGNQEILLNVLKTGIPYVGYSKPFIYKLNPERGITYWDWSVQRVNDENGKPAGVLMSFVDVTERRLMEERLLDSYKHLGVTNRKVSILLDMNKMNGCKETSEVTQYIVRSALKLSQAKTVSFYEYRRHDNSLNLLQSAGYSVSMKNKLSIDAAGCIPLYPLIKNKTRVQGAFTADQMPGFFGMNAERYNLFLPLTSKSQLKGCIHFEFAKKKFITTQELDFYEAFAALASSAMDKMHVFQKSNQMKMEFVNAE
ncbi:MAG: PAS domain S-box protein [Patescibacteria group bacterium]|nr:PAS domain S-box protein [Patescibacteria group bacterium]